MKGAREPAAKKAAKSSYSAQSLEALGAAHLADILIDLAAGDVNIKRRLKLELAGSQGPEESEREIRKRLTTIGKSRSFVDWQHVRGLTADLDQQRKMIAGPLAKAAPDKALELMWQFLGLAKSVFNRCDDSNGTVGMVFQNAVSDLGQIAITAKPAPETLAGDIFTQLKSSDYGHRDELIATLAPALGNSGLLALRRLVEAYGAEKTEKPAEKDRSVVGWGSEGKIYADEIEERCRQSTVRIALKDIADALGDVDAFLALHSDAAKKMPGVAAEIARRLTAAGRASEALQTLDHAGPRRRGELVLEFDWDDARIQALEALGRIDEAQAVRWNCFSTFLSAEHLRAYLKRLPDFEDLEAERRAMEHVEAFRSALHALHFLTHWPDLERAARLVAKRGTELDGNSYEVLSPAADILSARYPLAATMLLRLMIDHALEHARSSRYKHAARHLLECESLAASINDFGAIEKHMTYVIRLKKEHGRKSGFWSLIK